jgi:hypothetical protein
MIDTALSAILLSPHFEEKLAGLFTTWIFKSNMANMVHDTESPKSKKNRDTIGSSHNLKTGHLQPMYNDAQKT